MILHIYIYLYQYTYECWLPKCFFMMKFIDIFFECLEEGFFSLPGGHDRGAAWKIRFGGAFLKHVFSWRWMMIPYDLIWLVIWWLVMILSIFRWLRESSTGFKFMIVCRILQSTINFNNKIWHFVLSVQKSLRFPPKKRNFQETLEVESEDFLDYLPDRCNTHRVWFVDPKRNCAKEVRV